MINITLYFKKYSYLFTLINYIFPNFREAVLYEKFLVLLVLGLLTSAFPQWVPTNGPYGENITCFAVSGSNLFAGTSGGVFLSTNNGIEWACINNDLTNISVYALAVSGSNLFAGTNGGVYLSTNSGTNWTAVNTGLANSVYALVISGTNLFATTFGGVYLSTNNGTSWTVLNGLTATNVYALATVGSNLFAGTVGVGIWKYPLPNELLPVELTSFTAYSKGSTVTIKWETATEVNSALFELEKSQPISGTQLNNESWQKIASIKAAGNSNSPKNYSFVDETTIAGKYCYRLKMIDNDGSFKYSSVAETNVSAPDNFMLGQNYPNPFNPSTVINYKIPASSPVTLKVFNTLGKEIATLVNTDKPAGSYNVTFDGSGLSSGIYYYQLKAGSFMETKKFELLK